MAKSDGLLGCALVALVVLAGLALVGFFFMLAMWVVGAIGAAFGVSDTVVNIARFVVALSILFGGWGSASN